MGRFFAVLLPEVADNVVRGAKVPVYGFLLLAVVSLVRSCIHLLAPDGGAGTIAGMDLSVAGASGIIFAFALWGSSQLLYALIQLTVALRYRSLVPAMWLLLAVETLLRELVGHMKPVAFRHTPPGAFANYVNLPLALVMVAWCVWSWRADSERAGD